MGMLNDELAVFTGHDRASGLGLAASG